MDVGLEPGLKKVTVCPGRLTGILNAATSKAFNHDAWTIGGCQNTSKVAIEERGWKAGEGGRAKRVGCCDDRISS